jgi:O-antigen/teichoic acid export membrane protein
MLKKIAGNSVLYFMSSQAHNVINIVMYPLISEFLVAEDYYIFGTILGYVGMVTFVCDLGLVSLFDLSFFKQKDTYKSTWSKLLGVLHLSRLFFGTAIIGLIGYLFHGKVPDDHLWLILGMVGIPVIFLDIYRGIGVRYMQISHKHSFVQRVTVIISVITASSSFITIYVMKLHYLGFFITQFISQTILGIVYLIVILKVVDVKPSFKIKWEEFKGWMKFGGPVIPHFYSGYLLNNSDRIVLDRQLGVQDVTENSIGLYNVAYNFANYFHQFTTQVNTVITPYFFELFQRKDNESPVIIRSFVFLWLGVSVLLAFLAGLWSKEVFHLLFVNNTGNLADAYRYSVFLFMAFCYRPLYVASVEFAIFNEKTVSLLKITFVAGVANVLLNIILVPIFGVQAAILSTFACYMYMGAAGHFLPEIKAHLPLNYHPIKVFLIITGLGVLGYYAVELDWPAKIGLTLGIILLALAIYRWKGKALVAHVKGLKNAIPE